MKSEELFCLFIYCDNNRHQNYRGLLLDAAATGSTPTCSPLLHVIPLLSPLSSLSCPIQIKAYKCPQKNLIKRKGFMEEFVLVVVHT